MAYDANKTIDGLEELTDAANDDVFILGDQSDSDRAKKISWTNLKTIIGTYITGLASYFNKSSDTLDNITAGSTNKHFTSTDETKLDGIEASADVTDATNVAAAGAAMSGGAFHDGFSDFVANEHIDWTADQGATNIHAGNVPDLSATYATAAKGVTNGDSHNHNGGDGAGIEGTSIISTGESGGSKFLREDGDGTCSWQEPPSAAGWDGDIADINLDGGTDIGADLADADLILVDDGAGGTNRKSAISRVWTYINTKIQAITSLSGYSFLVDEDNMASNLDTKVPSQQSVKAYADTKAPLASPSFTGTVTLPTGLTGVLRADSGVVSADTDVTDIVSAASDSAAGKVELATAAETTTGTDTGRAVTPDGLAGSDYGKRIIQVQVTDPNGDAITTGDGKAYLFIPTALNGYNLVAAHACVTTVSSSGTPTVQIRNVTDSQDMLSTAITIDANEKTSYTAATAPVINTSYDDVATGDQLAIDIDVAGTGTKGLTVILTFQLP